MTAVLAAPGMTVLSNASPVAAALSPSAGTYVPVAATRVMDTRIGLGAKGSVGAGKGVALTVAGVGPVPSSGVSAVVLSLTVTSPTKSGDVTVYADGAARPSTTNLSFAAHETVSNLVVAGIGRDGKVDFYNASGGTVALIADLSGYYLSGTAAAPGTYTPVNPTRLLDTHSGKGAPKAAVASKHRITLKVDGTSPIPASGVSAVALTVTVTSPFISGGLAVYADGSTPATTSNVTFAAHAAVSSLVIAPVGQDGKVDLYNASAGSLELDADVSGYYRSGSATGDGTFSPVRSTRILDTQSGTGAVKAAVSAQRVIAFRVEGSAPIPATGVSAAVLEVTTTEPSHGGELVAYADGARATATTNLSFSSHTTVQGLVIAPIGQDGKVDLYNDSAGTLEVAADVTGYYEGPPPPGTCTGFTETTGITSKTITLANDSDVSGPVPGLDLSAQDAVRAYLAYFNSVSRICGRTLTLDAQDTKTSEAGDKAAAAAACTHAFAMVGSMATFDEGSVEPSQTCAIPDLRAEPSTLARQTAPNTYAAAYGDLNQVAAAVPLYFKKIDPTGAANAALLYLDNGSAPVEAKSDIAGWTTEGFHVVYTTAIPDTEFNYTSYVRAMQQKGVKYVQYVGPYEEGVTLAQAMQDQGFVPDEFVQDATAYDPSYISSGGSAVNNSYVYTDTALFQEEASNPEMQLYQHWLQHVDPGARPTTTGLYAWSAALLFTQVAQALGGNLTRAHLLTALGSVHSWTGDGLYSAQNVGSKITSACAAIIQLQDGAWVRKSSGSYTCGPVLTTTG
jgi:ABC-type branched-subunit amino acid transport system substrate-binding protein